MSLNAKRPLKIDGMTKKIPINPKYKDVKATVDTGASMSKYLQKIEDIKQNYKFSKDEIFKRIKVTTFVQLLVQVYRLTNADEFQMPSTPEDTFRSQDGDNDIINPINKGNQVHDGEVSNRSTLLGVSQGIGEIDLMKENNQSNINKTVTNSNHGTNSKQLLLKGGVAYSLNNQSNCPYILMDIRDKDEYDQCHIIPAISYPKCMLSRSVNYESQEMLDYKNKEGRIIVVYDEDEKYASQVATTLVQRGYDNIFMLSGGLKVASKLFPEGLITGTLPNSISTATTTTTTRQTKKSVTMTTTAEAPKIKQSLDRGDVDRLEMYLNNLSGVVDGGGAGSSRIGSSSRLSISSRSSSTSTTSYNGGRPVFKP